MNYLSALCEMPSYQQPSINEFWCEAPEILPATFFTMSQHLPTTIHWQKINLFGKVSRVITACLPACMERVLSFTRSGSRHCGGGAGNEVSPTQHPHTQRHHSLWGSGLPAHWLCFGPQCYLERLQATKIVLHNSYTMHKTAANGPKRTKNDQEWHLK